MMGALENTKTKKDVNRYILEGNMSFETKNIEESAWFSVVLQQFMYHLTNGSWPSPIDYMNGNQQIQIEDFFENFKEEKYVGINEKNEKEVAVFFNNVNFDDNHFDLFKYLVVSFEKIIELRKKLTVFNKDNKDFRLFSYESFVSETNIYDFCFNTFQGFSFLIYLHEFAATSDFTDESKKDFFLKTVGNPKNSFKKIKLKTNMSFDLFYNLNESFISLFGLGDSKKDQITYGEKKFGKKTLKMKSENGNISPLCYFCDSVIEKLTRGCDSCILSDFSKLDEGEVLTLYKCS